MTFREVRSCRPSGDHDLHNIRVLASASASDPYTTRTQPFPEGAILLKEEFDFIDEDCAGTPVAWTMMVKLAGGSSPETLGWRWFDFDADHRVITEDEPRCIGCHTECGAPPDGYDATCALP